MIVVLYVLMIVLMYFLSGFNKLKNFASTVNGFQDKLDSLLMSGLSVLTTMLNRENNPLLPNIVYQIIIAGVILLEIVAPVVIVVSVQQNKYKLSGYYCSIGLAVFTILATLMYHFPTTPSNYYAFMKNLTAIGGLLLLSKYIMLQNKN